MSPSELSPRRRPPHHRDRGTSPTSPSPSHKRRSEGVGAGPGADDTTHHRAQRRAPRRDHNYSQSPPPPSKRRRRSRSRSEPESESPSRSPLRRHRHHGGSRHKHEHDDRSPSPYRDADRKSHRDGGDRRKRSRSPYSRDKKSKRRDSVSRSRSRTRNRSPASHTQRTSRRGDHASRASVSPAPPRRKERSSPPRDRERQSRKPLPSQEVAFQGDLDPASGALDKPIVKEKPNFKPTGLLAKEANTVTGTKIVLKYNEPPEARKPPASQKWQLYVFKGDAIVDEIPLYTQSCWLLGREAAVADVHVEHPSASKQHAVVQFRHSVKVNEFGDRQNIVRPYVIDLESANGTSVNGEKIKDSRYYEIRDKDVLKIGLSEREYVFMLPPSS